LPLATAGPDSSVSADQRDALNRLSVITFGASDAGPGSGGTMIDKSGKFAFTAGCASSAMMPVNATPPGNSALGTLPGGSDVD
jgi:hypothetical protein